MAPVRLRAFALAAWAHAALALVALVCPATAELSFPRADRPRGRPGGAARCGRRDRASKRKLKELESKTTTQLVVVTLRSLGDYDIADYGYQLGRHWGIGQKGTNNGALLIVAPKERKVRIEVGYGLEGTLTDAVSRLIIDHAVLPRFRAGDFAGGIERATDDIIQVLSGDADDFKRRAAERDARPSGGQGIGLFTIVVFILVLWLFSYLQRGQQQQAAGRRRSRWGPVVGGGLPGGWSGGGWSGGSGGDSGGGGFSGGGGSFGGGGSSGSW